MPTDQQKKTQLFRFLQDRVFRPVLEAPQVGPDAAFIRDAQRSVERTWARYPTYETAARLKAAFEADLRSTVGQKLAALLSMLHLPRFEDVADEFFALCDRLDV